MRISYRQGLLSAQSNFLQIGQDDSRYVDIIVSPTPAIATAAFKSVNYLISEQRTVTNAWGPFTNSDTQYLYWEINQFNGQISRGATTLPLLVSSTLPQQVSIGQMWFDTSENLMKVFDGERWAATIRVFAGILQSGGILQPYPFNSQVGLDDGDVAGFIMKDGFGSAFRSSNGTLLTSDTALLSSDTGSLVKLQGSELYAIANENLPRFSAVYLISGRAALASGDSLYCESRAPMAVVVEDYTQNSTATLVTGEKAISNDQWNYQVSDIGKDVYCGSHGELTLVKPVTKKYVKVGTIVSATTILLKLQWVTELVLAGNGVSTLSVIPPLAINGSQNLVLNMPQASNVYDGFISASDFARIGQLETNLVNKADANHIHDIASITNLQLTLNQKADVGHSHIIENILGLQDALDNRALLNHAHTIANITNLQSTLNSMSSSISQKANKVLGATIGHLASLDISGNLVDSGFSAADFATSYHTQDISSINGLQIVLDEKANAYHTQDINSINGLDAALDQKADIAHTQDINSINGLSTILANKSDVGHGHTLSNVDGLIDALAAKADLIHSHVISEVTGLQTVLDMKANAEHQHVIGEVTGLQLALDSKANTTHQHAISDVTNLQNELDGKANTTHQHAISDVTNLQNELDGKANTSHMHTLSNNLADVDVITVAPNVGDSLVWDGVHWVPGQVGSANLGGKIFRLDMTPTIPREVNNVYFSNFDNYAQTGTSLITWDANGIFDSIKIPSGDSPEYADTIWEVSMTFTCAPIDDLGNPSSWLADNPGVPAAVRYGSYLDIDSGGSVVQLGNAEYDKYISASVHNRDIMWTQTVAIITSNSNMLFKPAISMGIIDIPSASIVRFAGSVMVNIKYVGKVAQAPQA